MKSDTKCAPKGAIVAWEQFLIAEKLKVVQDHSKVMSKVVKNETDKVYKISTTGADVFTKK